MSKAKKEIVLIGAGGHCRSVIDVIEHIGEYRIVGLVGMSSEAGRKVLGYTVIGTDDDLDRLVKEYSDFHIALGFIRSPQRRVDLWNWLTEHKVNMPVLISPLAYVSVHAVVGAGTIVMHQALVNASAIVGNNVIINTKALIEHDAFVGDHSHIATAAIINGGVRVGSGSFVGSGAVTRQGAEIPDGSFIKANSTVK